MRLRNYFILSPSPSPMPQQLFLSLCGTDYSENLSFFFSLTDISSLWPLWLYVIILFLSQKVSVLATVVVVKGQSVWSFVTCGLCWGEVILLLGRPYLPRLLPSVWEGPFLGLGMESTWRGLGLNKHWSKNSTSKTPVRIYGIFL